LWGRYALFLGFPDLVYNQDMPRTINGRQFQWQLLEQVGKGDAGEVLRVQAQPGGLTALMKRPVQNAPGGTILRQAVQIEKFLPASTA